MASRSSKVASTSIRLYIFLEIHYRPSCISYGSSTATVTRGRYGGSIREGLRGAGGWGGVE
jgi:hypothetical protein